MMHDSINRAHATSRPGWGGWHCPGTVQSDPISDSGSGFKPHARRGPRPWSGWCGVRRESLTRTRRQSRQRREIRFTCVVNPSSSPALSNSKPAANPGSWPLAGPRRRSYLCTWKTRTLCCASVRHIGHTGFSLAMMAPAHWLHAHRWPHGMNTWLVGLSQHTTQPAAKPSPEAFASSIGALAAAASASWAKASA